MTESCSERAATLVRGLLERVLGLTLREWIAIGIVLVVCLSTAFQQYIAYSELLPDQQARFNDMFDLNKTCDMLKKSHSTAYFAIEEKCKLASIAIQFTPQWSAFSELVNTTWPHSDNLVVWSASVLSKIFASFQAMILFVAFVVFFWPSVKRQGLGFMKDEINKRKEGKIGKELRKLAMERALSMALGNMTQQNLLPSSLHEKTPTQKEDH